MNWVDAEAAIIAHVQTQWALTAYAATQLAFDNENGIYDERYMAVSVEGTIAEKTIYGSTGKRSSVEMGIVFFHAFVPLGAGRSEALGMVRAMTSALELQTLADFIKLEGGAPPTPVEYGSQYDRALQRAAPDGNYYRCSGSVPFYVIDQR